MMEIHSFLINGQFLWWKWTGQVLVAICTAVLEKSNSKINRCLILEGKIGKVKAAKSLIFFLPNQSWIAIFYNCDESFCAWLTEIVHSSNFQKAAIYARNLQGSLDITLNQNKNRGKSESLSFSPPLN